MNLLEKMERAIESLPKPEKREPSAIELHLSKRDYGLYMEKGFGWQNPIFRLMNTIKMHPTGFLPVESDRVEDDHPKFLMTDGSLHGAE